MIASQPIASQLIISQLIDTLSIYLSVTLCAYLVGLIFFKGGGDRTASELQVKDFALREYKGAVSSFFGLDDDDDRHQQQTGRTSTSSQWNLTDDGWSYSAYLARHMTTPLTSASAPGSTSRTSRCTSPSLALSSSGGVRTESEGLVRGATSPWDDVSKERGDLPPSQTSQSQSQIRPLKARHSTDDRRASCSFNNRSEGDIEDAGGSMSDIGGADYTDAMHSLVTVQEPNDISPGICHDVMLMLDLD